MSHKYGSLEMFILTGPVLTSSSSAIFLCRQILICSLPLLVYSTYSVFVCLPLLVYSTYGVLMCLPLLVYSTYGVLMCLPLLVYSTYVYLCVYHC